MKLKILIIPAIIILVALFSGAYVIDETEQVVITQFGKAIGKTQDRPRSLFQDSHHSTSQFFPEKPVGMGRRPGPGAHPGQNLYLCGYLCPMENCKSP